MIICINKKKKGDPFLKIEIIESIKIVSAMNLNQAYFIQPTGESIHYMKPCPPPPRTAPIIDNWSIDTTFSCGKPTLDLPTPRSHSGAAAPISGEAAHSWSDLQSTEHESLRHLTESIEPAILPSQQADDIIHPDIKHILIRQRGSYWWEKSQAKMEQQFSSGIRQPVQGGFYVFLEEEQTGNIVRFGNVLAGARWMMQTVAFPKGHPDADVPPYQMIDVRE